MSTISLYTNELLPVRIEWGEVWRDVEKVSRAEIDENLVP